MLVSEIVHERQIDELLIGLPRLPSGEEGTQAAIVREYAETLSPLGLQITFVDERYSTPPKDLYGPKSRGKKPVVFDGNAAAACALLEGKLTRQVNN